LQPCSGSATLAAFRQAAPFIGRDEDANVADLLGAVPDPISVGG